MVSLLPFFFLSLYLLLEEWKQELWEKKNNLDLFYFFKKDIEIVSRISLIILENKTREEIRGTV